jgi:hypothetical protein
MGGVTAFAAELGGSFPRPSTSQGLPPGPFSEKVPVNRPFFL